jgi:hypothetical protein
MMLLELPVSYGLKGPILDPGGKHLAVLFLR